MDLVLKMEPDEVIVSWYAQHRWERCKQREKKINGRKVHSLLSMPFIESYQKINTQFHVPQIPFFFFSILSINNFVLKFSRFLLHKKWSAFLNICAYSKTFWTREWNTLTRVSNVQCRKSQLCRPNVYGPLYSDDIWFSAVKSAMISYNFLYIYDCLLKFSSWISWSYERIGQ